MKQLLMYHRMESFDDFPVPAGWTIRNWREGEIEIWTRICENGLISKDDGTFSAWKSSILGRENLVPERDIFFVCRENDVPEATLTAYVHPDGMGDIHMVAAAPSIRGNNVNRVMLAHGLKKLDAEMPHRLRLTEGEPSRLTELTTDDWRIPAVVGYLKGGFRPVNWDTDMVERWTKLCNDLNIHGIEMLDEQGNPTGIIL